MFKILIATTGGMLFSVLFVSNVQAYGVETHALLTKEIVSFYNTHFPNNLIPSNLEPFLIDGARHEDTNPRYLNHFYDPINNRGLADGAYKGQGSKYWSQDKNSQTALIYKLFARTSDTILTANQLSKIDSIYNKTDFTWQKAINLYAEGKTEEALFALGHIIHLIEDSAVPDHTRNDAHPPYDDGGSPYENWTKKFNLNNPDPNLPNNLTPKKPILLADLNSYFDSMANYSNNNFYSRDSVKNYDLPSADYFKKIGDKNFGYKIDIDLGDYKLFIGGNFDWNRTEVVTLNYPTILSDYWSRLSLKAVQHGTGVVDLFFKEGEKAKAKLAREKSSRPYLGLLMDGFGSLLNGQEIVVDNSALGTGHIAYSSPVPTPTITPTPTQTTLPRPIVTVSPTPAVEPKAGHAPVADAAFLAETLIPISTPTPILTPTPISTPIPSPTPVWISSGGGSSYVSAPEVPVTEVEPTPSTTPEPTLTPTLPIPSLTSDVIDTESSILDLPASSSDSGQIGTTPEPTPTPGPLTAVDFYKDENNKYFVKLSWSQYPFITTIFNGLVSNQPADHNWHAVVFYYNQEAPVTGTLFWINYNPNIAYKSWGLNVPNGFKIKYPNCLGTTTTGSSLILPDSAGDCNALAGNHASYGHNFSQIPTDGLTLEASADSFSLSPPVAGQDYISLAYYAFQPGYEPNNYGLGLVSIDPNKYYFK